MESLEKLIYASLKEEEPSCKGWDKETVEYVLKHKPDIEKQIRAVAKGFRRRQLQQQDIEDTYNNLLVYLHNCEDYNIRKAVELSKTGTPVPIEGYINSCIKFCVLRDCKKLNQLDSETVGEFDNSDEDGELSIFNTIPDASSESCFEALDYDLTEVCRSFEPVRYKFGEDLFKVMFIRLLTLSDKTNRVYYSILSVLNISKSDVLRFNDKSEDSVIRVLSKAISLCGPERAIEILRGYVYSADKIEETIATQL